LRWSNISGALKYIVSYRRFNTPNFITTEVTADSLRLTNLVSNTVYEFRVKTVCKVGDTSAVSANVAFPTLPTNPCNAPALRSSSTTSTKITFRWIAINNAIGYEVLFRKTSEVNFTTVQVNSGTIDSLVLANLTAGTQYAVKIRTKCSSGTSEFTPEVIIETLSSDPCNAPTNISVSPNINSAVVNWTSVQGAIGYVVAYRRVGGNGDWETETVLDPNATNFTIPNLFSNTDYETIVQTLCELVPSEFSNPPVPFKTLNVAACGTPSTLTMSEITKRTAKANWGTVAGAISYRISWKRLGAPSFVSTTLQAPNTTFTFSNLAAGTTYIVRVVAICSVGTSAFIERQFTTQTLKEANLELQEVEAGIYPNPNKGSFNLQIDSKIAQNINIKIFNLTGQVVYQGNDALEPGSNTLPIEMHQIASGIYLLQLDSGDLKKVVKVVVE